MAIQTTDTKSWDEFIKILENKLSGFASPWLSTLEPVTGLDEKTDNDIFFKILQFNFYKQNTIKKSNPPLKNIRV